MDQAKKVRVAVVGATGYTGAELLRLMHGHPNIEVTTIAGHGKVCKHCPTCVSPRDKVTPSLGTWSR